MNTVRTFTALFSNTTEYNSITFYKPGSIPTPVSSDRVASNIEYLNLVCTLPNTPVVGQFSGRTIEFLVKVDSSNAVPIGRIELRPAIIPYTFDVKKLLWGNSQALLSPDTELSARMVNSGYGFLSPNETLAIFGSATEQMEFNETTLIQQLS